MTASIGLDSASVVIRGHFNPAVFSPAWMHAQGLVGAEETLDADVEIVSPKITRFTLQWLKLQVDLDGLLLLTTEPEEFERLRDAAVGILETLKHTPVGVLGLNRDMHIHIDSFEKWHAIGDLLVPKDRWSEVLHLAGMRSVTLWGAREDDEAGRVQVTVEPSNLLPQSIYVGVNSHFDLEHAPTPDRRDAAWSLDPIDLVPSSDKVPRAVEQLRDKWASTLAHSDRVFALIQSLEREVN